MLRAGFEFFNFSPRAGEKIREVYERLDRQLEVARRYACMDFTWRFTTWMLSSILRLIPRKWSELFKDMGRRMSRDTEGYETVKNLLEREKLLEKQILDLHRTSGNATRYANTAFVTEELAKTRLGVCLCNPTVGNDGAALSKLCFPLPAA